MLTASLGASMPVAESAHWEAVALDRYAAVVMLLPSMKSSATTSKAPSGLRAIWCASTKWLMILCKTPLFAWCANITSMIAPALQKLVFPDCT